MTVQQTAAELPIAKAASGIDFFEKARLFAGHGIVDLGDELSRHPVGAHFRASPITGTIRNYRFENVVLDADTLMLVQDGAAIAETAYFVPPERVAEVRVREDALQRVDAEEQVIIATNMMAWNYQHWLTQCLPAVDWSLRARQDQRVRLVLPPLQPWQEELLALLGHETIPRLMPKPGAQYLLPHAEYSQFLNGNGSFNVCLSVIDTCRRLLRTVTSRPTDHTVIYVPAEQPHYGRLANEGELIALLQSRGVHVLPRGPLGAAERINAFHHAQVVIGPHSERLTDVVFCRPRTLLWELMPGHHLNGSINRLAQAAELDYWGDVTEPIESSPAREWQIDLDVVRERLKALSRRLAYPPVAVQAGGSIADATRRAMPLDELMYRFESLGDDCEFGLVQRQATAEPLGLLRFAGFYLAWERRLERLIAALANGFDGLGAPGTITVRLEGEAGRQEFLVQESAYDLLYHTFMGEAHITAEELLRREYVRLTYLRRKLLEDLEAGEKIWIWKSRATQTLEQVQPLMEQLRRVGPNILLWVVEEDEAHPSGTVERIEDDLLKGYIERRPPDHPVLNSRPYSWFQVCQRAHELCYPAAIEAVAAEPAATVAGPALTGIAYLVHNPAALDADEPEQVPKPAGLLRRLFGWLRGRGA